MAGPTVLVVGGGIVGTSCAYELARRGAAVTLLDDTDGTTSASTGNAGLVALGHPPLPRPGLLLRTLRWMFDPDGPLYVPWRWDPALWSWMFGFARACRRSSFEDSCRLMAEFGRLAGDAFRRLVEEESIECDWRPVGWMEVCATEAAFADARADGALLEEAGYRIDVLDGAALRNREPAFAAGLAGAVVHADSASIDPPRFLAGLADRAAAHGATVLRGAHVAALERRNGRVTGARTDDGTTHAADVTVLAAGVWSDALARDVGVRIPMQAGKGYHLETGQLDVPLTTAAVLSERHVAVTPMTDRLRLAGTVELSGINLQQHERRLRQLTTGAARYVPGLDGRPMHHAWCGLRPCTADGLPVIGPAPRCNGLFIATGHAKMGLCLGPPTGVLVSEWILEGRPRVKLDLDAMSPARFA